MFIRPRCAYFRQQYLKSKFGHGVEVEIQVERGADSLDNITNKLPYLTLIEKYEVNLNCFATICVRLQFCIFRVP